MRHAVIATHLMTQARSAAGQTPWPQDLDAPPELPAASNHRAGRNRRARRRTSLLRRARFNRAHA
jgi:hypothetical protein